MINAVYQNWIKNFQSEISESITDSVASKRAKVCSYSLFPFGWNIWFSFVLSENLFGFRIRNFSFLFEMDKQIETGDFTWKVNSKNERDWKTKINILQNEINDTNDSRRTA